MHEYDSNLIHKAIDLFNLRPLGAVFDDNFMEQIYSFEEEDPLKQIFYEGLEIPYKHLGTEQNYRGFHHKAYQLSFCINNILRDNNQDLLQWLSKLKKRYLDERNDNANKNGILGEIYTAGYFLNTYIEKIQPIKTQAKKGQKTPDFACILGTDEEFTIEVNTPSINGDEKNKIIQHKQKIEENNAKRTKKGIHIDYLTVCPAGSRDKYKTVAENWIDKISSIKSNSEQFSDNKMNLLVVNLFNKDMDLVYLKHFHPLLISQDECSFYSGNIFQAFYGKTGDKIFEDYMGLCESQMTFDGMFNREYARKISAAVFMSPYYTIVFENPNAETPLSYRVLLNLTKLHNFELNSSIIRIPKNYYEIHNLSDEIELKREKINSIVTDDCYRFV